MSQNLPGLRAKRCGHRQTHIVYRCLLGTDGLYLQVVCQFHRFGIGGAGTVASHFVSQRELMAQLSLCCVRVFELMQAALNCSSLTDNCLQAESSSKSKSNLAACYFFVSALIC